jgi:ABC-2 type transport system permease protein
MRLFLHVLSIEARTAMSYRIDFWINAIVGFLVQFAIIWFLWQAIFAESGNSVIGGWTFEQMVIYYVLAILTGKFVRGREEIGSVSNDIYEGGLSRYLVYPTNYFPFKYAQHLGALSPAIAQLFVLLLVLPLFSSLSLLDEVEALGVLMAIPSLVVANLLYFLIILPLQTVAFWADNVWSLSVLMRFISALLGGLMLPLSLFPDWAQTLLSYTPFPYLYHFPVKLMMGSIPVGEWLQSLGTGVFWCLILGFFARVLWKKGEKVYTGVGI